MASSVKVLAAMHTGITVPSLSRAIHLFQNILNLPLQRTSHLSPPISGIVGHPEAEIDIAIITLPGGHQIELLEYKTPAVAHQNHVKPYSWDPGCWHLCLTVESMDVTVKALVDHDAEWKRLTEPQKLTAGPNAGKRVVYMRNEEDGLVLELFE